MDGKYAFIFYVFWPPKQKAAAMIALLYKKTQKENEYFYVINKKLILFELFDFELCKV